MKNGMRNFEINDKVLITKWDDLDVDQSVIDILKNKIGIIYDISDKCDDAIYLDFSDYELNQIFRHEILYVFDNEIELYDNITIEESNMEEWDEE